MNKTGELFITPINTTKSADTDAWTEWNLFLTDKALAALLAPPPLKDDVGFKSSSADGRETFSGTATKYWDERSVSLDVAIWVTDRATLVAKLTALATTLKAGRVTLTTKYQSGVYYRLDYKSCTAPTVMNGLAKFTLKFNEPDPSDRGATSKHSFL